MKDSSLLFPDGRDVAVSDMTPAEITIALDAVDRGRIEPDEGETTTVEQFRERLLIELVARALPPW